MLYGPQASVLMLYCVALSKCMQYNTTPSGIQQRVKQ